MALPNGFKIVPARVEDRDRIEVYLRRQFFKYEPMHMSLGVPQGHHCTDRIPPLEKLHEGTSLMAVTTTSDGEERIVGVCLNGEETPANDFQYKFTKECEKFRIVRRCLMKVHTEAAIFEKTGANRALEIYVLSVDPDYRRNGIGRALVEHTVSNVAKEKGYPLVTVLCSSFFTAKIAEALGMKCVHTMRFDEYLNEEGIPVFSPPKPHEAFKFFTLAI